MVVHFFTGAQRFLSSDSMKYICTKRMDDIFEVYCSNTSRHVVV